MTGMDEAADRAAQVIRAAIERQADVVADGMHLDVQGVLTPHWIAEALATNGLLSPAPLTEEWSARYVNGGGAVSRTRNEAEAELDRMICDSHRPRIDEPPAPEIAGIYVRHVTDWFPAEPEADGSADQ